MIRLTEMQLAAILRCIPPALGATGVVGALRFPGTPYGWASVLAVVVGAYLHGRLAERGDRAERLCAEDGPPVAVPRALAQRLSGCEHVTLPHGDTPERAALLRVVLGPIPDRTLSWCPICMAVYSPPELEEHHRPGCTREQALRSLRAILESEEP